MCMFVIVVTCASVYSVCSGGRNGISVSSLLSSSGTDLPSSRAERRRDEQMMRDEINQQLREEAVRYSMHRDRDIME